MCRAGGTPLEHLWLYPDLSAGRLCPCGGNRGQSLGKQAASRAPSSLAARGLLPRRWAWRHGSRDDKPIGVPGGSGPEARADQGAGLPQSLGRADPVPEGARHCCCLRRSDSAIPPGSQRDLGKGGQRISLDALTAAGLGGGVVSAFRHGLRPRVCRKARPELPGHSGSGWLLQGGEAFRLQR